MKWFKGMTVCAELKRQGLLSDKEYKLERAYNILYVPRILCFLYKCVIIPIVMLMRMSPGLARLVHKIARKIWIDRALRKMNWINRLRSGIKKLL